MKPYNSEDDFHLSPCAHYTDRELEYSISLARARSGTAQKEKCSQTQIMANEHLVLLAREAVRRVRMRRMQLKRVTQ